MSRRFVMSAGGSGKAGLSSGFKTLGRGARRVAGAFDGRVEGARAAPGVGAGGAGGAGWARAGGAERIKTNDARRRACFMGMAMGVSLR